MKYLLLVLLLSGCGQVERLQFETTIYQQEIRIRELEEDLRLSREKECEDEVIEDETIMAIMPQKGSYR